MSYSYIWNGIQWVSLNGAVGPRGEKGDIGLRGPAGPAPFVSVGNVVRVPVNRQPTVTVRSSIPGQAVFDFELPLPSSQLPAANGPGEMIVSNAAGSDVWVATGEISLGNY
jgi:hypothetical protein